MVSRIIKRPMGLHTDANAISLPDGAMRTASNVSLRREGLVEPRTGLDIAADVAQAGRTALYSPSKIIPFDDDLVILSETAGGAAFQLERGSVATVYTGTADPPDSTKWLTQSAKARDSLYLTTTEGVRKLEAAASAALSLTGLSFMSGILGVPVFPGVAVTGGGTVAYRAIWVREDGNDYLIQGPPCTRYVIGTGVTVYDVEFDGVLIPPNIAAGDRIEFYRTKKVASGTTPSTEYFFSFSYEVTATDISNGYTPRSQNDPTVVRDTTVEADLGAALYTNPSQEGIVKANTRPPLTHDLEFFGECVWYANTKLWESTTIELRDVAGTNPTVGTVGLAHFFDDHATTNLNPQGGTFAIGSPVITAVGTNYFADLRVGMWIAETSSPGPTLVGTEIPADTYIIAFDAGALTITMSAGALANSALTYFDIGDTVTVDGVRFYASNTGTVGVIGGGLDVPGYRLFSVGAGFTTPSKVAAGLALSISGYRLALGSWDFSAASLDSDWNQSVGTLTVVRDDLTAAAFVVDSSNPAVWNPPLPVTSESDPAPQRMFYSKPLEPEAVPGLNFVDVGNPSFPIRRILALRDSLLVFKDDGLFRLTGTAPDGWRVDAIDRTLRLLHTECVATLDSIAFAWTDRGVAGVTETGAEIVSTAIASELRTEQELLPLDYSTRIFGAYMATHRRLGCVVLGVPDASNAGDALRWYVGWPGRAAWAKWDRTDRCLAYDEDRDAFYSGSSVGTWEVDKERREEDSAAEVCDVEITVTVSDPGGGILTFPVATIAPRGAQTGDLLIDNGGVPYRILTATKNAPDWELTVDGSGFTVGAACSWCESFPCELEWLPGQPPGNESARWREAVAMFQSTSASYIAQGPAPYSIGASSDEMVATPAYTAVTLRSDITRSLSKRALLSRNICRGAQLYPAFQTRSAGFLWRLQGIALTFEPSTTRVSR